jgi:hypothetical protein
MGAGMDRRSVHRYVAHTAWVAGISRPNGPHALRRTVGLNQGIPLRDIQHLLRHTCPEPSRRPQGQHRCSAESLPSAARRRPIDFAVSRRTAADMESHTGRLPLQETSCR